MRVCEGVRLIGASHDGTSPTHCSERAIVNLANTVRASTSAPEGFRKSAISLTGLQSPQAGMV